jgi:hypothetical protein
MRSLVILAGLVVGLATAWQTPHASAQQQGPACLHGPNETAAERDRRNAGLGLARALNTAQAGFASRNKGLYGTLSQLSGLPDLDAGAFEVKLVSNGTASPSCPRPPRASAPRSGTPSPRRCAPTAACKSATPPPPAARRSCARWTPTPWSATRASGI